MTGALQTGGIDHLDPDELIDSRIRVHDENQVELKLDYKLDQAVRRNRYEVHAYFFVPRTLGVDSTTYSSESFYADTQAYIRFEPPSVPLESLLDPRDDTSPLRRLKELVEKRSLDGGSDRIGHQLRMLACIVRASTRDVGADLRRRIEQVAGRAHECDVLVRDIAQGIERLCGTLTRLLQEFRGMRATFLDPQRPTWMRELFHYADEGMSVYAEASLTRLLRGIDAQPDVRAVLVDARREVTRLVLAEQAYRRGAAYPTMVREDGPNEAYVNRRGTLKKFMSSALYLEVSKSKEGKHVGQVIAGIAAGVAMLVATVLAIWSQNKYGLNTEGFIVALVLGYILKDRMKDGLKSYLALRAKSWLYDYKATIVDPNRNAKVGRCGETFTFLPPERVPRHVWKCRHSDAAGAVEEETKRESVMRYVKDIVIDTERMARAGENLSEFSDVIRFNVSRFQLRMDDPVRKVAIYDPASDTVKNVKLPKQYRINVVLLLRSPQRSAVTLQRFRVVMDKQGIRQVQEVATEIAKEAPNSNRFGRALAGGELRTAPRRA